MPEDQGQANLEALASVATEEVRDERMQRRLEEVAVPEEEPQPPGPSALDIVAGVIASFFSPKAWCSVARDLLEMLFRGAMTFAYLISPQRRRRQRVLKKIARKRELREKS